MVPNQDHAPSIDELRDRLREKLPEYMVPSAFVILDALPLTPNGKVDRRALPVPDNLRPELASTYQPPQSQIEQEIAKVWQTVLHLEKVGVNDNFFDLGGNSLLMVQVTNKLQAIFQRNLSVVAMFQHPTISSLAQYFSQQPEDVPAFRSMRDRAQKQMEVLNQRKNFWIKQSKKTRNQ